MAVVTSKHFLRRTARARARSLNAHSEIPGKHYQVVPASRGPYRWWVELERAVR